VLPIGGLKEKLLAAARGGITHVLIPEDNAKDLVEIPKNILADLTITPVRWIDQVLDLALTQPPAPLAPLGAPGVAEATSESVPAAADGLRTH
jgi:ATP-dependent Lon protease